MTAMIQITPRALAAIAEHAPASADGRETGGVLLGYDAGELGNTLVMEAGDPGPSARRERNFFRRDRSHAQALADEAFRRSCSRWIGEWHTHPRGALAPSRTDLRTYRRFLRDPELAFDSFLALIVGPTDDSWNHLRIVAWLIEPRRGAAALFLPHPASAQLAEPTAAASESAPA